MMSTCSLSLLTRSDLIDLLTDLLCTFVVAFVPFDCCCKVVLFAVVFCTLLIELLALALAPEVLEEVEVEVEVEVTVDERVRAALALCLRSISIIFLLKYFSIVIARAT